MAWRLTVCMQFVQIMDNVLPKLNAYQFKQLLESLYHVAEESVHNDTTKRRVSSRVKLLDETTGHTKSDFMAVLVSDIYDVHPQFALFTPLFFMCRLYAPSSLLEVVLVTIILKTYMRS